MHEPQDPWDRRVARWWNVVFRRPEEDRLAAALVGSEIALAARGSATAAPAPPGSPAPSAIDDALRRARKSYARGALDEGWGALEEAHRLAVFGASPAERRERAATLRREAEHKLTGWRRDAVLDACRTLLAPGADPDPAVLYGALLVRDGHHQNRYHQTRLLAREFKTVAAFLVLVLVAMWGLSATGAPMPVGDGTPHGAGIVVWMALFGMLGASFSLAFPLARGDGAPRIPDQVRSQAVTGFRPLLGAAAGPVAYAFVQAGIVGLPKDDGALLLTVAFVAGFSERLILRAVGAVAADQASDPPPAALRVRRAPSARPDATRDDPLVPDPLVPDPLAHDGAPEADAPDALPRRPIVALTREAGEAYRPVDRAVDGAAAADGVPDDDVPAHGRPDALAGPLPDARSGPHSGGSAVASAPRG